MDIWKSRIFLRIFAINTLVLMVLLLTVTGTNAYFLPKFSKDQSKEWTEKMAARIQSQIGTLRNEIYTMADLLQQEDTFVHGTLPEMKSRLDAIVDDSQLVDGGTILDADGVMEAYYRSSDLFIIKNSSLLKSEAFQHAVQYKLASFSDVVAFDNGDFALFLIIPVLNERHQIAHILTLHIYINNNAIFQSILQPNEISKSGYIAIIDRNGVILSHPDVAQIGTDAKSSETVRGWMGKKSEFSGMAQLFGSRVYASYQFVDFWEWGIIAVIPEEEMYGSVKAVERYTYPLFLAILLAQFVLTALYAHRIIRPIQRLYQSFEHVAQGNYDYRIAYKDSTEFGRLFTRFNEMIQSLHLAREEVNQKRRMLKEQHVFLRSIIDTIPSFIYTKDREGRFLLVNQSLARAFRTEPEKLIGRTEEEFRTPEEYGAVIQNEQSLLTASTGKVTVEESFTTPDGEQHWLQTVKLPLVSPGGVTEQILVVSTDITERKKSEELLRSSEKLSIVGELAAGVAHEIRNPLTSLKGFLQLIRTNTNESQHKFLEIMASELERINLIVNEFLMLAKPQAAHFQVMPLRPLLESVILLLEPQAHLGNILILLEMDTEPEPEPEPLFILCEEHQIKQVFVNMIKNAMEAMPDGGSLDIRVARDGEDRIRIRFTDHGCGMSPEHLQRIGRPFYTTKEKGTGLGLMVSFKIIEAHKGSVSVQSELGAGTTFEIILPLADTKTDSA